MNNLAAEDYIEHIVDSSSDILEFTSGLSRDRFKTDRRTQKAVVMSLIETGEAVTKISVVDPELISRNPDIPWRNMRGMRNRIALGYFDIDQNIVWETVNTAIPDLHKKASDLLDKLQNGREANHKL